MLESQAGSRMAGLSEACPPVLPRQLSGDWDRKEVTQEVQIQSGGRRLTGGLQWALVLAELA